MTTIYRENAARLSVADAKRLILDAVPLEKAYNVYAKEDDEGNIEWEGEIKVVLDEKANIQASDLDNDFLATCDALSIRPRMKYRPVLQNYSGNVLQDVIYTIAHDEFVRLAESFCLLVEMGKAPEPQVITTNSAPLEAVGASGDVQPDKAGPGWNLKTSIDRAPGYRWPLYQFLKAAHIAGQPIPKAREVLDAWALKPPPNVQVMSDGIKYDNGLGKTKEANLRAMQQAIKGLLK